MSYTMGYTAYASYRQLVVGQYGEFVTAGGNNTTEEAIEYVDQFMAEPELTWGLEIGEWFAGYNSEHTEEPVTMQDVLDAAPDVRQSLVDQLDCE